VLFVMIEIHRMGYELHITRQTDWFDEDPDLKISPDEWKNYVHGDPEMRLDNYCETKLEDGRILRIDEVGISVWLSYTGNGLNGNYAWFSYSDGNINVKSPDDEILKKMLLIAERLNAKVLGDDGERYPNEGIIISARKPEKPWWKFW